MLRTLRGMIGTAITWAVPWAIVGGVALTAQGYISLSRLVTPPASIVFDMLLNGALVSGVVGLLSGAAFAGMVAVRDRGRSFGDLSYLRMLSAGAIGSGAIAAACVGVASLVSAEALWPLFPLIGVSAALGAASATGMLKLARGARDPDRPALRRPDDRGTIR